jgi:hypothetical protein
MRFGVFIINIGIHNHPLEKFVNEDQDVVAILVGASGAKQNEL